MAGTEPDVKRKILDNKSKKQTVAKLLFSTNPADKLLFSYIFRRTHFLHPIDMIKYIS